MSTRQGLIFVIVGPSAAGKNALMVATLKQEDRLEQLATVTTRERRANEQDDREHMFVSVEQFQAMIASSALLEWQEVHPQKLYGVPRQAVEDALAAGKNLIADIDVLGATYIRSLYPENVVLIFVQPPSVEALADRMHERGETEADIQMRLTRVAMEMDYLPLSDYVVVNDDFAEAAQRFHSIITSEIDRQHRHISSKRIYTHSTQTLPIFEDMILRREVSPHYPQAALFPQEIPHVAALRALQDSLQVPTTVDHLLRIKPNKGSFFMPVQVEVSQDGRAKQALFTYVYM
ncbi:MAG: guanylate kinase, partial [Anaerolineae bacterium]|nr:guanylate kinase [Anaerolineae bacterium]